MEKTVLEKLLPSRSGALVMGGLIAFGVMILGGLYISPAAKAPAVPANTPIGAPGQKLRFVCYDLGRQHPEMDPLFSTILKLDPDYVFLQDIDEDDVVEAVQLLQMQNLFHPRLYQRSEHLAGRRGTWGNVILSKLPLYAAEAIGGKRGGFGVWAVSVVDGKQFFVACMHFSAGEAGAAEIAELEKTWKDRGSPPMVAAMLYSDANPPAIIKSFSAVDPRSNGQWFNVSQDWTVAGMDQTPGAAKGRTPAWIDAISAQSETAATRPAAVNGSMERGGTFSFPSIASLASRTNNSGR